MFSTITIDSGTQFGDVEVDMAGVNAQIWITQPNGGGYQDNIVVRGSAQVYELIEALQKAATHMVQHGK